jgi:tetratricopeptide (TPR) repeat protein
MASAAGLHVHAALASVERKVDEAFPSPAQFDHVITYAQIGGQDVWLDTTTELAPFRMLVAPLRGKPALVISADGKSALRKVPKESAVANVVTREVDGTINGIGTLDADIKVAMRGDIELLGRIALRALPQPRWKELVQLVAPTAGSAEEISNLTISEIGDTSVPLEFDFHVTRLNYFSRFGSAPILFLPIGVIFAGDAETPAGTDPIDLFARKVEYHARLRLPAQFTPRLPVPVEVKRDYAEYASKYALQEGLLTVDRTLNVKVEDLPASRANDLEAFRRAVTTDERQMVAMQVGAGGGADDLVGLKSDDLLQAGQAAYDSGDYQTAADLASRVVKSEPKHNSAWADLGRAYVASGEMEEAESALKTAVEINPYSPDAYDNLGRVYIAKRRTGEAEKAFRKQIEINPLDEWAHRLLGHLLLQRKDYAGAAAELEKAVAIDGKDAEPFLDLGRAQIGLDKVREAGESFDRAVELKPDPEVWNEIAYALADHKTGLDKAQQYAESAVASVTAYLRNVHLPDLRPQDLAQVALLGACWDTLGWIRFRRGETTSAEKYLLASWQLTQAGAVADHLGRLYDSRSKNAQAIEYYAFANVAPKPETGSRSRLFELAGNLQANQVLTQKHDLVPNLRSFTVPGMSASGSAEFFVVIGPGSKVEDVRFISGDNALKPLAPALKRVDYKVRFPDANETQIVRRGILVCGPKGQGAKSGGGSCDFILLLPADVHSVD